MTIPMTDEKLEGYLRNRARHNEASSEDVITAQVIGVGTLLVILAFAVGLAIGGFYF
jgi:hypothetical protein